MSWTLVDTVVSNEAVLLFAVNEAKIMHCFHVRNAYYILYVRLAEETNLPQIRSMYSGLRSTGFAAPVGYEVKELKQFSGTSLKPHRVLELHYATRAKARGGRSILEKQGRVCTIDWSMTKAEHFLQAKGLHPHGQFSFKEELLVPVEDPRTSCDEIVLNFKDIIVAAGLPAQFPDFGVFLLHVLWGPDRQPWGCVTSWGGKSVFMVATAQLKGKQLESWDEVAYFATARDLAIGIITRLRVANPVVIMGHDLKYTGITRLLDFLAQDGIYPESMSLMKDKMLQQRGVSTYTAATGSVFYSPVPGRIILDIWVFLKRFQESRKTFSLESLCNEVGVFPPKDTADKLSLAASSITIHRRLASQAEDKIVDLHRVVGVFQHYASHWKMIETLYFFSTQTFHSMQDLQDTSFSAIWRSLLWARGLATGYYPHMDKYAEGMVDDKLQGGVHSYVDGEDEPTAPVDAVPTDVRIKAGLYKNVVEFDYRSDYATAIIAHNLCVTTINRSSRRGTGKIFDITNHGHRYIHEVTDQREGLMPRELKQLISMREQMKDEATALSLKLSVVLKLLANSLWGLIGSRHFFFSDTGVAQLVTAQTRNLFYHAVEVAQNKLGLRVIYGYTDSIIIADALHAHDPAWQKSVAAEINRDLPAPIRIQCEGVYDALILSLSNMFLRKGNSVVVKGTAAGRKDYPEFIRQSMVTLVNHIFDDMPLGEFNQKLEKTELLFVNKQINGKDLQLTKHYTGFGLEGNMKEFFIKLLARKQLEFEYGEIVYLQGTEGQVLASIGNTEDVDGEYYWNLICKDLQKMKRAAYKTASEPQPEEI